MGEFEKDLSKKMIAYRAKENIPMHELAKRCNVSTQTIYSVENLLQKPSRITAQKILNVVEEKGEH